MVTIVFSRGNKHLLWSVLVKQAAINDRLNGLIAVERKIDLSVVKMSCSARRHHTCGSGGTDAERRVSSSVVLPPIAEERLLDTTKDVNDDDDDDDDGNAGECCRCCCQRRDHEAPPAWRDLDVHGLRCMLPARRRQRGCFGVAVRRYDLVPRVTFYRHL